MQGIINSHFQNHTILSVTHRLDGIIDFDRVLVMENGVLVEDGQPRALLAQDSIFRELYKSCRGWQEYERQEKKKLESVELRRRQTVRARERVQKSLSAMTDSLDDDTQEDRALRSTIREHWSRANEFFGISRRDSMGRRARSRSVGRESHRSSVSSDMLPPATDRRSWVEPGRLVSATMRRG